MFLIIAIKKSKKLTNLLSKQLCSFNLVYYTTVVVTVFKFNLVKLQFSYCNICSYNPTTQDVGF